MGNRNHSSSRSMELDLYTRNNNNHLVRRRKFNTTIKLYRTIMKNLTNILLSVLIVLCVGLYFKSPSSYSVQGISSSGVTNTTAKLYTITVAPSTDSATTSSLFNNDGTDRMVIQSVAGCTGVGTSQTYLTGTGLASFKFQMSTSSISVDAKSNTNYASNIVVATSSAWAETASTTLGAIGAVSLVWPTQTYLNITSNATNTAACTVGVSTISL